MSAAALAVYQTLRREGTQQSVLAAMQMRKELYEVLNYMAYEAKLDQLFAQEQQHGDHSNIRRIGRRYCR